MGRGRGRKGKEGREGGIVEGLNIGGRECRV